MEEPNHPENDETGPETHSVHDVDGANLAVSDISATMQSGKTPRGRRRLKEAVRVFKAAGQNAEAAGALCLLARLELRSANPEAALTAVRGALRLVRHDGAGPELETTLSLLCRVSARLGEAEQARAHAQERLRVARARHDARAEVDALLQLAATTWAAGDVSRALCLAEDAVEASRKTGPEALTQNAECRLAALLLRAGCATAANRIVTRLLHGREHSAQHTHPLLVRGWTWICLARPDAAARDFRRMVRLAREAGDKRSELEGNAALAAAEGLRGVTEEARAERARTLADRVTRQSRRLRDAELEAAVQDLVRVRPAESDSAAARKEAARSLVALAQRTDSLTVSTACLQEVERLNTLAAGEAPYGCNPADLPSLHPLED